MSADTILGVNPGTRRLGVAVMRNGKLVHCEIKSFTGKWSYEKLQEIIAFLEAIVHRDGITKIAVKIPDVLPTSLGFTQVIGSLNALCDRVGIRPRYFTFSEVKARHCKEEKPTAAHLMAAFVGKYPELRPHYQKEQQNEEAYYRKVFEAVAAAHMVMGRT